MDQPFRHLGVAGLLRALLPAVGRDHLVFIRFFGRVPAVVRRLFSRKNALLLLLQAFPQLPEDVLRLHADAVQRSSLAQHHPPHHCQPAARRGEEGHLEGPVAHHH